MALSNNGGIYIVFAVIVLVIGASIALFFAISGVGKGTLHSNAKTKKSKKYKLDSKYTDDDEKTDDDNNNNGGGGGGTVDVINETALQRQTREHFARTLEKAEDEFFTKLADQEFDTYKSENVWLIKDKITDGKVSIPEGDINVPDVGQAIADENLFDLIGTNHDEVKETMDEVVAQKSTNITYEQLVIDLTNILLFGTVTVDPSDENGDESLQRSTDPDAEMVMLTTTPSSQLARQQQPPQPTPDYLARYSKELVINNIRGGFISDRDMRTWQGRMSVHVNMKQRTFNVISAATNLDSLQVGLEPVLQKQGRAAVGGRIEKARIEFSFVVEGNRVRVYATNKTEDCFCSLLPNCYNVKKASDYWISSASTAKEKTYLFIANKNDETSFFYNFEEGVEEVDLDIFMTIDCAPNLPFIKNLPRPITDNNIMVALS
ncbi:envelope protein [White spot syndrome virus]|uniref:Wsv338 n=2 Tax=White spot syndrome virus TaxID=342409 RepID=A0A2U9GG81_WSSV|nr:envelope protein [White spot syndrome virus]AWQ61331.1 wsv338 [Shrimp white spot syndrome virus]AWM67218.1 envelope protein [White spot syndrome virus]AWQ63007.1 wsv338 [Shrimp white spot syndrome virus]AWQ63438.1 wsv338 [Shrimp white spot syndrome virus]